MAVKLNKQKATMIRALARKGWSQRRLAKQYKVGRSTVYDVLIKRTWA